MKWPCLIAWMLMTPALGQSGSERAWGDGLSDALDLPARRAVTREPRTVRTRGGEVAFVELGVELDGLTVWRRAFESERDATSFHRARSAWEPDQPCVAQVRGAQLVVLAGPRVDGPASFQASALRAAFAGDALPSPGATLEVSVAHPWREKDTAAAGVDRVALSRASGGGPGTYHGDVTLAIQRARQGEAEAAYFLDLPVRNHLLVPLGDDALQACRLGAADVALHADVRDAEAAKRTWEALKALLEALDDPGFEPADEAVGPTGPAPRGGDRRGAPVDGALGD